METVKRYLNQPSTWRGLALLLSAFGIIVSPDAAVIIGSAIAEIVSATSGTAIAPESAGIVGAGVAMLAGVIETVRDSDKSK